MEQIYIIGMIISGVAGAIGISIHAAYKFFYYNDVVLHSTNWRLTDLFLNLIMGTLITFLCAMLWPIAVIVGLAFGVSLAVIAFRDE